MTTPTPLQGSELIDCARANAPLGIEVAAQRCGYSSLDTFQQELKQACQKMGIEIEGFADLTRSSHDVPLGVDVAPETSDQL